MERGCELASTGRNKRPGCGHDNGRTEVMLVIPRTKQMASRMLLFPVGHERTRASRSGEGKGRRGQLAHFLLELTPSTSLSHEHERPHLIH